MNPAPRGAGFSLRGTSVSHFPRRLAEIVPWLTAPGSLVILACNVCRRWILKPIRSALVSLFVLALAVTPASGQVLYGSIRGTVEDPGHSVIPGAAVTLTNKNAGSVQSTVTGATGAYSFVDVSSGIYTLVVSAPGFKSHTQTEVEVSINTVTRVDVQLQVGQVSERVEVTSEASALQTEKADVHVELAAKEVSELPLPGYRNYQSLLNLVPGATPAAYQ